MDTLDVTIGEAFHRWRISHNMTLNTVAEGITTPSTVSRFERGETQIGTPVFLALLARLRDNFEMLQTYFAGQDRNAFFQRVSRAATVLSTDPQQGMAALLRLYEDEGKAYGVSHLIFHKLNQYNLITVFGLSGEGYPTQEAMIKELVAYFDQLQHFTLYDLDTLASVMRILDDDTILRLLFAILSDGNMSEVASTRNTQYAWLILNNAIAMAMRHQHFDHAKKLLALAEHRKMDSADIDDHFYLRFHQVKMAYHEGHQVEAERAVQSILNGLQIMGNDFFYHFIKDGWQRFISEEPAAARG